MPQVQVGENRRFPQCYYCPNPDRTEYAELNVYTSGWFRNTRYRTDQDNIELCAFRRISCTPL